MTEPQRRSMPPAPMTVPEAAPVLEPQPAPAPGAPEPATSAPVLLRTEGLAKHFKLGRAMSRRRTLHAVDDFGVTIGEHEIVALAGESGSGKSTVRSEEHTSELQSP